MNINQLVSAVQRLHQKTSLTSDERASILQGLNDARLFAERSHDFNAVMGFGFILVDPDVGGRFDWVSTASQQPLRVVQFDALDTYDIPYAYSFCVRASDNTLWLPLTVAAGNDPALRRVWALGTQFYADDIIHHGDYLYLCSTDHTASTIYEPGVGSDWTDVYFPSAAWEVVGTAAMRSFGQMRDVVLADVWDEDNEAWVLMDVIDSKTFQARWESQTALNGTLSFVRPTLVLFGDGSVKIYGALKTQELYTVRLYGPFWLAEYVDVSGSCVQEDFLTRHGHDFLMWSAALDANMIFMTWIPRQEGAMPPPEQRRERAWEALLDWDNFQQLTKSSTYIK